MRTGSDIVVAVRDLASGVRTLVPYRDVQDAAIQSRHGLDSMSGSISRQEVVEYAEAIGTMTGTRWSLRYDTGPCQFIVTKD